MRIRITAAAALVALSVVAAACGEGPLLENVGDLSERVVHGESSTTLPGIAIGDVENPLVVKPSDQVAWYNAGIGDLAGAEGAEIAIITTRVWQRGEGVNRFVQADPRELAVVLPDVEFPAALPPDAAVITSQLVFDVGSGLVDAITSAAFGVWNTTPYTVAREQSQIAVLRVGQAAAFDAQPFVGIQVQEVEEGLSLQWLRGDYRYELFCREGVDIRTCRHMAENMVRLATLVPAVPAASAAGSDE